MARAGSLSSRMARHAGGCLAYFVLFGGLAWGLDTKVLAGIDEDLRPWAGIAAAVFLTLGLGSLWGIVSGHAKWNPKGELLAATATGALPAEDGQVLAIGTAKPVSVFVETFGSGDHDAAEQFVRSLDFRPRAIIQQLGLLRPIYRGTTNYGHFGREGLPWEVQPWDAGEP